MSTGIDSELVKVVQEHVRKLSNDVVNMSFERQGQMNSMTGTVNNIQLEIEKLLQDIELLKKRVNNLEMEYQNNCRIGMYNIYFPNIYSFDIAENLRHGIWAYANIHKQNSR
jgi:SMC interacting uncharacterized protein involved in chromosome segregation